MSSTVRRFFTPLALLALTLLAPRDAAADDALWQTYDAALAEYDEASAECEELGYESTSGDRACRRAAQVGARLTDALGALLHHEDDLFEDDVELAIDAWLTYRQHVASILTDVGECRMAARNLELLANEPELIARPLLYDAVAEARVEAAACVEAQTAAARPITSTANRPAPWGWVVAGVGVAALGAGVGVAAGPLAQANDDIRCWNDACPDALSRVEIEETVNRRSRLNTAASALVGVGGAAVIGGITWALIERAQRDDVTDVSAWFNGESAGVTWTMEF